MKEHDVIPPGTIVRVSHDIEKTDRNWTVVDEMYEMRGKTFKVKMSNPNMVYLDGFYFDPRDVTIKKKKKTKKEKQEFHFDPEELIT